MLETKHFIVKARYFGKVETGLIRLKIFLCGCHKPLREVQHAIIVGSWQCASNHSMIFREAYILPPRSSKTIH